MPPDGVAENPPHSQRCGFFQRFSVRWEEEKAGAVSAAISVASSSVI